MPTPPKICFEVFHRKFAYFSFLTFANSISSPSDKTPLDQSAWYGHLGICQLLVSSKADVNSSGQYAHTP
jgi:ankyrin repeat protein